MHGWEQAAESRLRAACYARDLGKLMVGVVDYFRAQCHLGRLSTMIGHPPCGRTSTRHVANMLHPMVVVLLVQMLLLLLLPLLQQQLLLLPLLLLVLFMLLLLLRLLLLLLLLLLRQLLLGRLAGRRRAGQPVCARALRGGR